MFKGDKEWRTDIQSKQVISMGKKDYSITKSLKNKSYKKWDRIWFKIQNCCQLGKKIDIAAPLCLKLMKYKGQLQQCAKILSHIILLCVIETSNYRICGDIKSSSEHPKRQILICLVNLELPVYLYC